jgi:hypothetical protein
MYKNFLGSVKREPTCIFTLYCYMFRLDRHQQTVTDNIQHRTGTNFPHTSISVT